VERHELSRMTGSDMQQRDIVVVGASAGGVEALAEFVHGLPDTLPAAVFVVLHLPADAMSYLPRILDRAGPLPAAHAADGEAIYPGRVYIAPPNHHLIVDGRTIRLTVGPRVNNVRPSIDVLFRSAARAFDGRVIGVVLSGTLDDGTLGLEAIRLRGGVTIIQHPGEAKFSGMPRSALERVEPDYVLPVSEIARLLVELTAGNRHAMAAADSVERNRLVNGDRAPHHAEHAEGNGGTAPPPNEKRGNLASGFTCPNCHGSLWELEDEGLPRIECRVGHAFSVDAFLGEQAIALEDALWSAINALEERGAALRRFASRFSQLELKKRRARYLEQAETAERQAAMIRDGLARVIQAEGAEAAQTEGR
jgi:two-component system, chemotaxis family, protein-glutamate methylesterase/glutaminase